MVPLSVRIDSFDALVLCVVKLEAGVGKIEWVVTNICATKKRILCRYTGTIPSSVTLLLVLKAVNAEDAGVLNVSVYT